MAGDWIKMRAALASDPKVMAIVRELESDCPRFSYWLSMGADDKAVICDVALRHLVTGALHNVWCNANEHASQGVVANAELEWVDSVCGVPGMGRAMESVGWLEVIPEGLCFPKFSDNNTSGADRQRRYREKKRNKSDVTGDVTGDGALRPREEKRREEKKENTNGRFVPPSVEEVRAYCLERRNGIDPQAFVDYYEARGWKLKGNVPLKSWKAAVRTWEKNGFSTNGKPPERKARVATLEELERYNPVTGIPDA